MLNLINQVKNMDRRSLIGAKKSGSGKSKKSDDDDHFYDTWWGMLIIGACCLAMFAGIVLAATFSGLAWQKDICCPTCPECECPPCALVTNTTQADCAALCFADSCIPPPANVSSCTPVSDPLECCLAACYGEVSPNCPIIL